LTGWPLPLWYHPLYTEGIHPEARFPRTRYTRLLERLKPFTDVQTPSSPVRLVLRTPNPIDVESLHLAHDPMYVERFMAGTLSEKEQKRIGLTPWTPAMVERTLRLMGGALEATQHVLKHGGIAANMAGGTHHAHRTFGSGYCIFNDLAVCALHALNHPKVKRVAILDLDVHQGDGTASILRDENAALTVSVHCATNFPFRKSTSDHDLPLPADGGDLAYLEAVEEALDLCMNIQPDLLLFQAGVDALGSDALGRLNVTRAGLRQRNDAVFERAEREGVPVVVFMGGGYAKPMDRTLEAFEDVFTQAARWQHRRLVTRNSGHTPPSNGVNFGV